jgi:hypothetical protein
MFLLLQEFLYSVYAALNINLIMDAGWRERRENRHLLPPSIFGKIKIGEKK